MVVLRSIAETELAEATEWYLARSRDAARRFVIHVDATLARVAAAPQSFPYVSATVQRAIVPHFPYAVYFIVLPASIAVVAIHHGRRHPRRWLRRE
jgi:plasmid stabilization system protein ParE